jgi:glycosyltransferase 2 family protein
LIRNIIKYLLFLSIGVVLFYLASLDITRGSLVVESTAATFEVGSGLETNKEGLRRIELSAEKGSLYQISSNGAVVVEGELTRKVTSVFLKEGQYQLQSQANEGASVVLNGINRTQALKDDMSKASIPGIVLSFVLGYLAIVSRGLRWIVLLEPLGYRPSNWRSVHAVAFAYFANTFVPRSGELARCAALNQTEDIPVDKLFGTVISERVVDFVMLFLFMSVAVLGNLDAFSRLLISAGGGEAAAGSNKLMIVGIIGISILLLLFIFRKRIIQTALFKKAKEFLKGVGEGLKSVLKMRRKGAFIFHTIFIWSMYFAMAYAIFKSMEGSSHLTTLEALFIMVAGGFGMVLPAPGGIGAYHWTVKLAFIALGLSGAIGFTVANVMWLTQTAMIIITGGFGYLALMFYRIRKDRKIAQDV